jgi:hypothetical protein
MLPIGGGVGSGTAAAAAGGEEAVPHTRKIRMKNKKGMTNL